MMVTQIIVIDNVFVFCISECFETESESIVP